MTKDKKKYLDKNEHSLNSSRRKVALAHLYSCLKCHKCVYVYNCIIEISLACICITHTVLNIILI